MTFTRSALFAVLIVTSAAGCRRTETTARDEVKTAPMATPAPAQPAPTPDEPSTEIRITAPDESSTDTTMTDTTTNEGVNERVNEGTSSSYGAGAVGGAAIAHGLDSTPSENVGAADSTAVTTDRQGRSVTVRRRGTAPTTTTSPTPADTTTPSDTTTPARPNDVVVPPSQQQRGTSDTSTQGTRSNPDVNEQDTGGGDAYDRNR
jgi:hypothetical protein